MSFGFTEHKTSGPMPSFSTTLASMEKMCGKFPAIQDQSIGWLLLAHAYPCIRYVSKQHANLYKSHSWPWVWIAREPSFSRRMLGQSGAISRHVGFSIFKRRAARISTLTAEIRLLAVTMGAMLPNFWTVRHSKTKHVKECLLTALLQARLVEALMSNMLCHPPWMNYHSLPQQQLLPASLKSLSAEFAYGWVVL